MHAATREVGSRANAEGGTDGAHGPCAGHARALDFHSCCDDAGRGTTADICNGQVYDAAGGLAARRIGAPVGRPPRTLPHWPSGGIPGLNINKLRRPPCMQRVDAPLVRRCVPCGVDSAGDRMRAPCTHPSRSAAVGAGEPLFREWNEVVAREANCLRVWRVRRYPSPSLVRKCDKHWSPDCVRDCKWARALICMGISGRSAPRLLTLCLGRERNSAIHMSSTSLLFSLCSSVARTTVATTKSASGSPDLRMTLRPGAGGRLHCARHN